LNLNEQSNKNIQTNQYYLVILHHEQRFIQISND